MTEFLLQIKNFFSKVWQGIKLIPGIKPHDLPRIFKTTSKKELIALGPLLLLAILAGSFLILGPPKNHNAHPYGGELVEGLLGQPRFINPVLASASSVDMDLSRLAFSQLLKFDQNLILQPDLADSLPTVSADQKTFTLKLKPNLKWQDGVPITADDVVFTIQTIQNIDISSPARVNWSHVKVQKQDDLTLTFQLREVASAFISNFTIGIIPKHIWSGVTGNNFELSETNLKPIGSGPFQVSEIKKTNDGTIKSITLAPNKNYYQGRPYLNKLTFKFYPDYDQVLNAYQNKDVASLGFTPFDKKAFLDTNSSAQQYTLNLPQYQAVFFNLTKSSPITDKAVRQALWLTTDRANIIDQAYFGQAKPSYGPILPGNLGYNPQIEQITHFNVAEAADILNRGGWTLDAQTNIRVKNKKPLEFNLITNDFAPNTKTAQLLQKQWSQIGANVHIITVGNSDLDQQYIRPRNFDALLFSENTGADPDPFAFWHSSQSHDPGLNLASFANTSADKLLTGARATNDVSMRAKDYQQFQLIVTQEIPAIFLDSSVYVYNVPKKIHGINLTTIINPSERFLDIAHWYQE